MYAMESTVSTLYVSLEHGSSIEMGHATRPKLITETESRFFKNQKIRDHYKPFSTFLLYDNYLLLGHANMISAFNTETQKWDEKPYTFSFEKDSEEDAPSDGALIPALLSKTKSTMTMKNLRDRKVRKIFQYSDMDGQVCVGVLF